MRAEIICPHLHNPHHNALLASWLRGAVPQEALYAKGYALDTRLATALGIVWPEGLVHPKKVVSLMVAICMTGKPGFMFDERMQVSCMLSQAISRRLPVFIRTTPSTRPVFA